MSCHADSADPKESPVTEYAAAIAQQRAEWKIASDASRGVVERVIAYARWLAATERAKALSARAADADQVASQTKPPR